jgi:tRNA pseudouridine synthase 10
MQPPPLPQLYVEGRYRKPSRDLPQTIFYCPMCRGNERRKQACTMCGGFGKLARESVQELITWVLAKAAGTRKSKFHGAGREDVDVRMLGTGRPFVIELEDVRITFLSRQKILFWKIFSNFYPRQWSLRPIRLLWVWSWVLDLA